MFKTAQEHRSFYESKGMQKTADFSRYLPWLLGAGLLGSAGYGVNRLVNPPTMWDKMQGSLGEIKRSLSDMGSDVSRAAMNNPQLINSLLTPPRLHALAQQPMPTDAIPAPMDARLQPYLPTTMHFQENPPMDLRNYEDLQSLQDRMYSFSPYQ